MLGHINHNHYYHINNHYYYHYINNNSITFLLIFFKFKFERQGWYGCKGIMESR